MEVVGWVSLILWYRVQFEGKRVVANIDVLILRVVAKEIENIGNINPKQNDKTRTKRIIAKKIPNKTLEQTIEYVINKKRAKSKAITKYKT